MLCAVPRAAYILKLFGLAHDRKRRHKEQMFHRSVPCELVTSRQRLNTRRLGHG